MSPSLESRLQYQHHTIQELIEGYNEEQLRVRPIPDKWSPLENMAHLARYQEVFLQRIYLISTGSRPLFERYIADNDPGFDSFVQKSLPDLSASFLSVRTAIYEYLKSRSAEQLSYIGLHPKFGALSLLRWTEFFLLHEAHHLFTIFKLMAEGPWAKR